ncbi:hypothetical protein Taro_038951 [Colocasia esculenta]|uniref:Uncharacterized protein n=1 Tax=Colocasia esculenta TaxID=4460 RepID=A0A843WKR0_COLES|nr:hypothetical protein [Colocasia esculenta]
MSLSVPVDRQKLCVDRGCFPETELQFCMHLSTASNGAVDSHTQVVISGFWNEDPVDRQKLVCRQAQDHGGPSIMERFKRMLTPSFKGESDPLLAESWMREIKKISCAIRFADDDKVTLATYMLQERADVWWASLLRTRFEDGAIDVA